MLDNLPPFPTRGGQNVPTKSGIKIRCDYDKAHKIASHTGDPDAANPECPKRQKLSHSGQKAHSADRTAQVTQQAHSNMSSVIHNNMFDGLPNDVEDAYDTGPMNQVSSPTINESKKFRCPPITVTGITTKNLREFFATENIPQDKYHMKTIKNGVQLILGNKQYFLQTITALKQKEVQFYSFVPAEEVPVKIVLSGLTQFDLDELKEELNRYNVCPKDIKVLSVKNNGVEEDVLYLLFFAKGTVKLQELRQVRSLFNLFVNWRHYVKKKNDVVQCHRCQRFGHGKTNCNMIPSCVKCGERHETTKCKLPVREKLSDSERSNRTQIKCANCSGNHTANFRGCPTRKNYQKWIEERAAANRKPQKSFSASEGQRQSSSLRQHSFTNVNNGRPLYSEVVRTREETEEGRTNPELFSISEFLCLARDMFHRLQGCRNKQEQFVALSELMLKYIYNA